MCAHVRIWDRWEFPWCTISCVDIVIGESFRVAGHGAGERYIMAEVA